MVTHDGSAHWIICPVCRRAELWSDGAVEEATAEWPSIHATWCKSHGDVSGKLDTEGT